MLDEKQSRKKGTELDFTTKQLQISYLNTKANKGKYKTLFCLIETISPLLTLLETGGVFNTPTENQL